MTPDYFRIIGGVGVVVMFIISLFYIVECHKVEKERDKLRRKLSETRAELEDWKTYSTSLFLDNVNLSNKLDRIKRMAGTGILHESVTDTTLPEHTTPV